jgi:AcrR family transcriptional regulator
VSSTRKRSGAVDSSLDAPADELDTSANGTSAETGIAKRRAMGLQYDDYRQRRRSLLRHAAELFHAKGLGDTSLADVARAGGLDRASIYYYFANKEEVFAEVLREAIADNEVQDQLIVKKRLPPDEKLRRLIVAQMAAFDKHYPYLYVYVREDIERLDLSADLKAWIIANSEARVRSWRGVIEEGIKAGTFETDLPTGIVAWTLIGAVAWSHRWYEPNRTLGHEAIGEGLAALLVDGLRKRQS